jgi:hypothetical protein
MKRGSMLQVIKQEIIDHINHMENLKEMGLPYAGENIATLKILCMTFRSGLIARSSRLNGTSETLKDIRPIRFVGGMPSPSVTHTRNVLIMDDVL